MKYCSINIGSNSSKMMIAKLNDVCDINKVKLEKEYVEIIVTGLGENVYETGSLNSERMDSAINTLACFKKKAEEMGVDKIWVTSTAATRVAENAEQFNKLILERTGLNNNVISYSKEAELVFKGVWGSGLIPTSELAQTLIVDSGGSSTEFIRIDEHDENISDNVVVATLDIGCLSLTNEFLHSDPYTKEEFNQMCSKIDDMLHFVKGDIRLKNTQKLIGVGGAALLLAQLKRKSLKFSNDIHGFFISRSECEEILNKLLGLTNEDRIHVEGMNPDRANAAVAGIAILYRCMHVMEVSGLHVSTAGILEGMILDMAQIKTT